MRILLIEDEKEMALAIKNGLKDYFTVDIALTGKKGEEKAQADEYDLIIIDFILPDTDGVAVCKKIREVGLKMPILFLTGQDEVRTKVLALNAGADDYLIKPFKFAELLARIRALLRRPPITFISQILSVGDLSLDLSQRIATRKDRSVFLSRKQFQLLEYFMRNVGITISREMILEHAWDSTSEPKTNLVDVHVNYLRDRIYKALGKRFIKTVRGLGYKIEI